MNWYTSSLLFRLVLRDLLSRAAGTGADAGATGRPGHWEIRVEAGWPRVPQLSSGFCSALIYPRSR
jgi:hypothetical protein